MRNHMLYSEIELEWKCGGVMVSALDFQSIARLVVQVLVPGADPGGRVEGATTAPPPPPPWENENAGNAV